MRVVDPLPNKTAKDGILRYEACMSLVSKVMQREAHEIQKALPKENPIIRFHPAELPLLQDMPNEVRLKMLSNEVL